MTWNEDSEITEEQRKKALDAINKPLTKFKFPHIQRDYPFLINIGKVQPMSFPKDKEDREDKK